MGDRGVMNGDIGLGSRISLDSSEATSWTEKEEVEAN